MRGTAASRTRRTPEDPHNRDQLRKMARAGIVEIKTALEGHDDQRRAALRSLLRGRFLQVGPDPERLFRVTGELQVGPI